MVTNHTVEGIMSEATDRIAIFGIVVFVANLSVVLRYLCYLHGNCTSQLGIENSEGGCVCRKPVVGDTCHDQFDLGLSGERDRCKIYLDLFLSPVSSLWKAAFSKEFASNLARGSPAKVN